MPLVINALRGGHTDRHTYRSANKNNFKKPGARSLLPHVPGSDFIKAVKMKSWLLSLSGFNCSVCKAHSKMKSISFLGGLLACPQKIYALKLNLMHFEAQNCYAKDSHWESVVNEISMAVQLHRLRQW